MTVADLDTAHSYAVAIGAGPRPRHVRHVQVDGKHAMCGVTPVVYVGARAGLPDTESWLWCVKCIALCEAIDNYWWWNADVFNSHADQQTEVCK